MKIEKINNWFEKFARYIIKKCWLVISLFFASIAVLIIGLKKLVVELAYDGYFLEDGPMLVHPLKLKNEKNSNRFKVFIIE